MGGRLGSARVHACMHADIAVLTTPKRMDGVLVSYEIKQHFATPAPKFQC